jgi:hypothetical protein
MENQLVANATKAQDKLHIICTTKIGRISWLQNATKSSPKKLHIRAIKIGGNQLIAIAAKARQKIYRFEQLE